MGVRIWTDASSSWVSKMMLSDYSHPDTALSQDGHLMGWGNDSCWVWFDVSAGPLTDSPVLSASLQWHASCLGKQACLLQINPPWGSRAMATVIRPSWEMVLWACMFPFIHSANCARFYAGHRSAQRGLWSQSFQIRQQSSSCCVAGAVSEVSTGSCKSTRMEASIRLGAPGVLSSGPGRAEAKAGLSCWCLWAVNTLQVCPRQ
jgi:hypothetical protein